jgi:hypothetical protein
MGDTARDWPASNRCRRVREIPSRRAASLLLPSQRASVSRTARSMIDFSVSSFTPIQFRDWLESSRGPVRAWDASKILYLRLHGCSGFIG